MADESLQAQWDAAIAGGDLATLERIGPQLYPEDGTPPPAPAPSGDSPRAPQLPAVEYARRTREIRDEMMKTNMGSPQMAELQAQLEGLLQTQHPEPTPAELEARPTPADVRPALGSSGYEWDDGLVRDFEMKAPGGLVLMHVAAEAIRAPTRWPDLGAALEALEARHGEQEADALLDDALAFQKAPVPPAMLTNLHRHGVLYAPDVIRAAAFAWRGHASAKEGR